MGHPVGPHIDYAQRLTGNHYSSSTKKGPRSSNVFTRPLLPFICYWLRALSHGLPHVMKWRGEWESAIKCSQTQKERADMFFPRSESLAWRPDYYRIPTLRGSGGGENVQSLEQEMRRGRESILFRAQSRSSSSPAPRHNLLLSGDSSP